MFVLKCLEFVFQGFGFVVWYLKPVVGEPSPAIGESYVKCMCSFFIKCKLLLIQQYPHIIADVQLQLHKNFLNQSVHRDQFRNEYTVKPRPEAHMDILFEVCLKSIDLIPQQQILQRHYLYYR